MQDAVAAGYSITSMRVGDVAWLRRPYAHHEMATRVRLWEDAGGRIVGWTYLRGNGGFNLFVAPGFVEPPLLDAMLATVVETARAAVEAGDPDTGMYTFWVDPDRSPEDRALAAALERTGFRPTPATGGVMTRSLLTPLPEAITPPGYRLGWVRTREEVIGRVEAHRAAFAPSEVTLGMYERVRATWPYRPELDRVALTEGGEVVAFCTAWIDEVNQAGLLEPVGTVPAHQRRGLARAVCADALRVLRDAGAVTAQVGYGAESGHRTYLSVGFADSAADLEYRLDPFSRA